MFLLPCCRSTNSSTQHTGQLLLAHIEQIADSETDQANKANGEERDQPELNTDILLLTCWTRPVCSQTLRLGG